MPKRTKSYREWQLSKLADPARAKRYLNSALEESLEAFLIALGKVAQARQMSKVATDSGVKRETLYRSFSVDGNPTLDTLSSVLKAVGLKIAIAASDPETASSGPPEPNQGDISYATNVPAAEVGAASLDQDFIAYPAYLGNSYAGNAASGGVGTWQH